MKRSLLLCLLSLCLAAGTLKAQQLPSQSARSTPIHVNITSVNTTVCAGDYLKIYFQVSRPFGAANQFSIELSDANGSFAAPTTLRTITGSGNGVVSAPVPEDADGTHYRIRMVSSNPSITSADNGSDITINPVATIEAISNEEICPGSTNGFGYLGTGATYTWENDNTSIGLAASGSGNSFPTFNAANNTVTMALAHVKVKAVSAQGCASKGVGFRIMVYPRPTITQIPNAFYCRGSLVLPIFITGPLPGTTYTWTAPQAPGIGLPITSGGNIIPPFVTINPRPPGQMAAAEFTLISTSPQGCTSASSFTIIVNDCGTQSSGTGGDANTLRSALTVGPNPAIGDLHLSYSGQSRRLTVEIRDASGITVIAPQQMNSSTLTVNTGRLFAGSYYAVVTDAATGVQTSVPFVKL